MAKIDTFKIYSEIDHDPTYVYATGYLNRSINDIGAVESSGDYTPNFKSSFESFIRCFSASIYGLDLQNLTNKLVPHEYCILEDATIPRQLRVIFSIPPYVDIDLVISELSKLWEEIDGTEHSLYVGVTHGAADKSFLEERWSGHLK